MKNFDDLQLSKDLIRFPSVTPIDAGAINYLSDKLKQLGFNCKILEFKDKESPPIKNLYARLGNKQPNLCYAGHTDVVPPGNINDWTVNPFKPKVKNNHLIGRGANDMKSSIACFIAAISNFLEIYFIAPASTGVTLGKLIRSFDNCSSLKFFINLLTDH